MKVKDLIKYLKEMESDREIIAEILAKEDIKEYAKDMGESLTEKQLMAIIRKLNKDSIIDWETVDYHIVFEKRKKK